jgi:ABC-type sugar transport system ATPase subunit
LQLDDIGTDGTTPAVDDVSFTVTAGEIFGMLGRNDARELLATLGLEAARDRDFRSLWVQRAAGARSGLAWRQLAPPPGRL